MPNYTERAKQCTYPGQALRLPPGSSLMSVPLCTRAKAVAHCTVSSQEQGPLIGIRAFSVRREWMNPIRALKIGAQGKGVAFFTRPWARGFFWHGWRRHVRRDCTGHLALRISELPARKETTEPKQKATNKTQTRQQTHKPNQTNGRRTSWQ